MQNLKSFHQEFQEIWHIEFYKHLNRKAYVVSSNGQYFNNYCMKLADFFRDCLSYHSIKSDQVS